MCLDNLVARYPCFTLQAINILGEEFEQKPLLVQQVYEGVRNCRPVLAGIQLLCEGVEWQRVLSKEGQLEDGLGVWEIQALEVGVQPCLW